MMLIIIANINKHLLVSVSGVGGNTKIPLNLRQGSTSNGNKRGSKTHKSNGKKETTQKKEDKRQDHSESDCSGVYHQDEMSATRAKSISEDSGDFHPTAKVNVSLYNSCMSACWTRKNISISVNLTQLLSTVYQYNFCDICLPRCSLSLIGLKLWLVWRISVQTTNAGLQTWLKNWQGRT